MEGVVEERTRLLVPAHDPENAKKKKNISSIIIITWLRYGAKSRPLVVMCKKNNYRALACPCSIVEAVITICHTYVPDNVNIVQCFPV